MVGVCAKADRHPLGLISQCVSTPGDPIVSACKSNIIAPERGKPATLLKPHCWFLSPLAPSNGYTFLFPTAARTPSSSTKSLATPRGAFGHEDPPRRS